MSSVDQSFHTVAKHRGRFRVWIQNLMLVRAGFVPGAKYERIEDRDTKTILLILVGSSDEGTKKLRTVTPDASGKPIIDLCDKTIGAIYGVHSRVVAEYLNGMLRITLHHICALSDERVNRLITNLKAGHIKEGTFCTGLGLATLALHEGFASKGLKMETEWIVDRESKFLDASINNNKAITRNTQVVCGKMEELPHNLLRKVDVLQISMSCKVHARSSKAKQKRANGVGEDHADAAGIYGLLKNLESINAAVIASENVIEARTSATFILLKAILNELHYDCHELILDSSQSGSFENRTRYWLVAVDRTIAFTTDYLPRYPRQFQTFAEFMEVFPEDHPVWHTPTEARKNKLLRDAKKGNRFSIQKPIEPHSTEFPVLRAELTKRGTGDIQVLGANGTERSPSVREHCIAKSVPESLVENLGTCFAHYCLGQGIDMNQGRGIGEMIAENLIRFLNKKEEYAA